MAEVAGSEPRLPEEIVLWEILTRLPSKPLLRCRAVCRSWRRLLTSDEAFLLAHHRRQPALQLVTIGQAQECRVDVLNHRDGERRPVVRTDRHSSSDDLHLLAACDGLLVVFACGAYHICNPATRQRAPLPLLRGVFVCSLYPHRPSRSYRVLCGKGRVYYVYTVGSSELRCVGEPPEQWTTSDISLMFEYCYPPILVQGRLHWRPMALPGSKCDNMLVFDTMAEAFRSVRTPVEGPCADPFEMKGELGLYSRHGQTVDLWMQEDHEKNLWSFKHRIKLERPILFLVPDAQGDVFVISMEGKGGIGWHQCLKHLSGTVETRHKWSMPLNLTRHRFKESLIRHDFFLPEESNGGVDETPLFQGLSTAAVLRDDTSH
ncbi:hypothetical protein QYE76_050932 [Lolium multiflorum]|uniref:F-box domain-containing protein n=1 Tax=Lolium multiflorum TaxID=4521 RepID=A0AAD8SRR1_LOLMU|nr:hypothetical protein QYE76_050923 [Lolium multiflorum]KAK1662767.1 hypothetical protein QYE76_050926 [Lolium multiflorum]KAK1662770.1 hypothetical protein QYE76_050929 [Lolium multiflorum]KAK1662773.1 hypothetical protein QYE76_050932 [Lolium multiflorum]